MALSLGVHRGSTFQIGGSTLRVARTGPGPQMELRLVGSPRPIFVTAGERVEVLPEVFISMGGVSANNPGPRLCFEAPKEISITRL